nr:CDP-alcohol phosphatidyltransferase family protein [Rhizobium sp. 007]
MLRYLIDPANAITTAGLLCSSISLYLALNRQIEIAIAVALWAVLADHLDGVVAGRTPNRHRRIRRHNWFCRKTFHRVCNQYGRRRSGLKMSRQIEFPDHGRFQRQSLPERRDFIRGIFLREICGLLL